jgi:hypothetical protein
MSEFTKGPWKYDNYGSLIMGFDKGGIHETEEMFMVAQIRGWGHLQYLGHDEAVAIQEANAHLIAAAPDMYAALKRLIDYVEIEFEGKDMTHGLDCAVIHATDIVAKAEGKS